MSASPPTATRPQLALQSYLDALLQEATDEPMPAALVIAPEPTAPVVTSTVSEAEFEAAVREERQRDLAQAGRPALVAPPPGGVAAECPSPPRVPAPVEPLVELSASVVPAPPRGPSSEGVPSWGEQPFECLLFEVAGLTLAVPLVSLGSIYPLEGQELTPLFGQPDWFLGILPCQAGNLKVLDSARWLMPERYRDECREGLRYVISVQGYEWGLAVHQVSRSLRLDPREVKWRPQRSQRPWLAGTVIEHMCALVDVAALAELIASGATRGANAVSPSSTPVKASARRR